MAQIEFLMAAATTTTVTIPDEAPDIKWMQTTSAILVSSGTTTWEDAATAAHGNKGGYPRRRSVIAWDTRHVNAAWSTNSRTLVKLSYREVGALNRRA